MRIHLLGTGGADGIPGYFSDDRVTRYAREHGGKDVRTRAAALVDSHMKLDFGPDTFFQLQRDGIDARAFSAVIFTHTHDDHFDPKELQYMLYPFNEQEFCNFTIFGNERAITVIQELYPDWPFELVVTHSFVPFTHAGYTITPVHAYHKLNEDAHNLLISDGSKTFFYATDTGVWRDDTWEFLQGWSVDGMVIECTDGLSCAGYAGHLDAAELVDVLARLREMKVLAADTPIYTTHHAHGGEATHAELEEALRPLGAQPGYDGLVFEI